MFILVAIAAFLQIPGKSTIEIDHTIACQRAQTTFRPKDNDFHFTLLRL
jgi:hypothetical protein